MIYSGVIANVDSFFKICFWTLIFNIQLPKCHQCEKKNFITTKKSLESRCSRHWILILWICKLEKKNRKIQCGSPTPLPVRERNSEKTRVENNHGRVSVPNIFESIWWAGEICWCFLIRELQCTLRVSDASDVACCHRPRIFGTNIPWNSHQKRRIVLQDVLSGNRIANVEKMATITTHYNSLLQSNVIPLPPKIFSYLC